MAKPKVISLYTGAGGLDLGLEAAGFKTAVCVEMDRDSCSTIRANRNWPVIEQDIHDVSSKTILKEVGLTEGETDLLVGGPPCQPFSKSGYWATGDAKRLRDPRSDTLGAYMRVLEDTKPKAFLLENVRGLAYKGKDEGLRLLEGLMHAINKKHGTNYRFTFRIVQAAEFGVPQIRERVFVVGQRDGVEFQFPEPKFSVPTDQAQKQLFVDRSPARTAWDAIGDLPEPTQELAVGGRWGELLPSIPEGHNYLWHTDRRGGMPLFGWRTRYWSFLLKLAKNRPSWTLQAQPGSAIGPFHWSNRRLSSREMCRLQTFPDDFEITGGRTAVQRQVGNAVPSLLAEILGRQIRKQLLGGRVRGALKLLPLDRSPAPPPELVDDVPQKYHQLAGIHAPHPGTGRGPSAQQELA